MFSGINNILWNLPHIQIELRNILQNTVSPIEHCYGSE
jgi:hypothetical protein